ncbi:MAG: FAD-binding protein [Methanomassiliicoccales archaeon]|jgi:glycolate oxidase|nr:FAD-binding protein [Methanomassiliicoccales archaeon]
MDKEILDQLVDVVGKENASTEPVDLVCYSVDCYAIKKGVMPDIVLRPGNAEEVSGILKIANKFLIPVVPRASGSSLTGACVPTRKGIVMDVTRMNRILNVSREDLMVTTECGVVFADLNAHLRKFGLFFPPDPASGEICTVGGMVAANASGMRAVKYGVTGDYLLGLKVVLPDGRILDVGTKARKSASGYDLVHLFNRSEGTLGVIVEITLKLKAMPRVTLGARAKYSSVQAAGSTVARTIASGVVPAAIELLDSIALQVMREEAHVDLPPAEAMLFLEFDGDDRSEVNRALKRFTRIALEEGCDGIDVAKGPTEFETMWMARKRLFATFTRLKPSPIATDIVVPLSGIPAALKAIQDIGNRNEIKISTYGHAGDGNLHSLLLADHRIPGESERAHKAHDEINEMAMQLSGTITGEHGIGLEKKKLISKEHGLVGVEIMKRIKSALDPNGIMNPDKIFEA